MRVLITGGLGFLGARLAVYLDNLGYSLKIGTRKLIKKPVWLKNAQITQLKWDDFNSLVLSCTDVDVVVHAAGMNSKDCVSDPRCSLVQWIFNGAVVKAASQKSVENYVYQLPMFILINSLVV